MALKTEKAEPTPPPVVNTTVLELALYKKYTWQGTTYEIGKPYRFKNADAIVLLGELDFNRPVWKLYRPAPPKIAPKVEITDATMITVAPPTDDFGSVLQAPRKRIDIGDDSEIQDVLSRTDESGDVTV